MLLCAHSYVTLWDEQSSKSIVNFFGPIDQLIKDMNTLPNTPYTYTKS